MFTLLHNADREDCREHEKYFFLPQWKYRQFTNDTIQSMSHSGKVNGQLHFAFSGV